MLLLQLQKISAVLAPLAVFSCCWNAAVVLASSGFKSLTKGLEVHVAQPGRALALQNTNNVENNNTNYC